MNESLFSERLPHPPASPKPRSISDETVKAIYKQYPRKAKPKHAYKMIKAALRDLLNEGTEDPVSYLMQMTKAYAEAVKTWPESMKSGTTNYVPHPGSWYNSGCYDEDQNEWFKGERKRPKPTGKILSKWEDELKRAMNSVSNAPSERDKRDRQAQLRTLLNRVPERIQSEPSIIAAINHGGELL
jgi:hypothetical protein